jgi:type III secretion protein Q
MPPSEPAATLVADLEPVRSPLNPEPEPKPKRKQRPRAVDVAHKEGTSVAEVTDSIPRKRAKRKPRSPEPHCPDVVTPEFSQLIIPDDVLPLTIDVIDHPATVRIDSAQAVLSRVLGAGRYARLTQLGPDALLELQLSKLPSMDADPYCALVLHGPAGTIELSDGVRLLLALTGLDLGESAVETPESQWFSASVLGRLAGTPLQDTTSFNRGCLLPDPQDVSLCLSLRGVQHAISITAKASATCWLDFLARGGWLFNGRVIEHQADLPLTFYWRIGSHRLDRSVLAALVVGDIVFPETCWFDCSGTGQVGIGSWQLSVVYSAPAGMTLLSLETRMDASGTLVETDSLVIHPPRVDLHDPAGLDTLPLQLHFDMGCCHTTLGGLRTLVAGSVLPIEGGSPAAIGISTGGRTLGQGELVEVNGQLAIRITYWS